jgi:hypothetical protein
MIRYLKIVPCILLVLTAIIFNQSCERTAVIEPNPFEDNKKNQDTVNFVLEDIDPNTIAGLYQNIFGPTCANIGCHDGTFEPDFRTIESSYHSMVYRIPIKNDGSLTYRVDPGNPNQSAIVKRLNGTIEPPMPIEIEPDSDWLEKEQEYIQNVRTWIENGALDLAGNAPDPDFIHPSLLGAAAIYNGEFLNRLEGFGSIKIPDSVNIVEIYLGFDPINNPENFSTNELLFGYEDEDGFQKDTSVIMEILADPMIHYSLYGKLMSYTHKAQLNLDALQLLEEQYFMRIRVQDGGNPVTEIPADNGLYYIKEYMSFHRTE